MTDKKSNEVPEKFIRLLEKAMAEHPEKLSLNQVARRADISGAYLSLLLNGERGVPSNDTIAQLERVLQIPKGELFKAAARPDDAALEFFRKDEAGPILRTLSDVPAKRLSAVQKLLERFLQNERRIKGK